MDQSSTLSPIEKFGDDRKAGSISPVEEDLEGLWENAFDSEDEQELDEKLSFVSQELCHLGITPYKSSGVALLDFSGLIVATYDLLSHYHQMVKASKETISSQTKTLDDLSVLTLAHSRLKENLEQKERTIVGLQEVQRQLRQENSISSNKMKLDKDEIRRLNCVIQARDVQYKNEIRKREHQMEKMKDRIGQFFKAKNGLRFPGLEITNIVTRKDGSRAKWNTEITTNKSEDKLLRDVENTYEERCLTLTEENNQIRECFLGFYEKLEELCEALPPSETSELNIDDAREKGELNVLLLKNHFQMPFKMIAELINENLRAKMGRIGNFIQKYRESFS